MKLNKKGFTIVELVIVIAVIAILAAVLIPTFSNIVAKAQQSSATQVATNAVKSSLLMTDIASLPEGSFVAVDYDNKAGTKFEYGFKYTGNALEDPQSPYNEDGSFKTALMVNGKNEPLTTVFVSSEHITSTTSGDVTTYSVDALLADVLVIVCGGDSAADNTANVTVAKVGDNYQVNVTVNETAKIFNVCGAEGFAPNAFVFSTVNVK